MRLNYSNSNCFFYDRVLTRSAVWICWLHVVIAMKEMVEAAFGNLILLTRFVNKN